MTSKPGQSDGIPGVHGKRLWPWWALLTTILAAEAIAISLGFDVKPLERSPEWWAELLSRAGSIPPLALVIASAVVLLRGEPLNRELVHISEQVPASYRAWPYLVVHLLAFAAFSLLTARVVAHGQEPLRHPGLWIALWLASGTVGLVFLGVAAMPPRILLQLFRGSSGALPVGVMAGFVAWSAGKLTEELWRPLGRLTLWSVHGLLGLVVPDVRYDPSSYVVGTSEFRVEIASQCSGYQGIGLIVVLLTVYLWVSRKRLRFPHALGLYPIGIAAVWLANVVRVVALILVGTWGSTSVAVAGFHSNAGWFFFCAVALILVALAQRSGCCSVEDRCPADDAVEHWNPTAAYLVPFMAIVAISMLTGAFTAGFDPYAPMAALGAGLCLWGFRAHYASLGWSWSWTAVGAGGVVFLVWILLNRPAGDSVVHAGFTTWSSGLPHGSGIAWLAARLVGFVVVVPLAEELAFRGYLFRRLMAPEFQEVALTRFTWIAFLGSSVLYGMLHRHWIAAVLTGMIFAMLMVRRGRFSAPVLAHATANLLLWVHDLIQTVGHH